MDNELIPIHNGKLTHDAVVRMIDRCVVGKETQLC